MVIDPRSNWQSRVENVGLTYHSPEGKPYWDESICYHLSSREVDVLEAATEELQQLCLKAGQFILDQSRLSQLAIPEIAYQAIRSAWEAEPPSIYGRFDLAYDGINPPKLLEYNANTPTALLEASVVQWYWLKDKYPRADQFNSIHEKLVSKWVDVRPYLKGQPLYFTSMKSDEDLLTVAYLRDTAREAMIQSEQLFVREIGHNPRDQTFRDLDDNPIRSMFSLYPWEWLLQDMPHEVLNSLDQMDWIEPIWKMLWSNKGLLAILWEMFPGHPNLLPAYLDGPRNMHEFVKKPLLSREGSNITTHRNGDETYTEGPYGAEGFVYQGLAPQFISDGFTPVIGSWYITDQGPAGVGIREDRGVTGNLSRFVPHYFD